VLGQFVVNRTQEIGVRMAAGAQSSDVLLLIAKQGGVPAVAGLGLGLLSAMALGRYLASLLYGVRASDPLTFAAVSLTLLGTAAIAMWIPARRAARVDPIEALRNE
jgi:putative ABC transport system permease protein